MSFSLQGWFSWSCKQNDNQHSMLKLLFSKDWTSSIHMSNNDTGYHCGYHYFVKTVDKEHFLLETLWISKSKQSVKNEESFSQYIVEPISRCLLKPTHFETFSGAERQRITQLLFMSSVLIKIVSFFLAVFCSSFIFHQVWELSTNDTWKWTYWFGRRSCLNCVLVCN